MIPSVPAFAAAVTIVLSVPMVLGLVPRNWLYGFRTRRTMSDARIWYTANRFAGQCLIAAGAATLLIWSGAALIATDAMIFAIGISAYLVLLGWAVTASVLRLRNM